MNHYGTIAQEHWTRAAPLRTAALEDPARFFTLMGDQVLSQVDSLSRTLQGKQPEDESYMQTVGRLNAAKKQAEEIVLAELVWITPEISPDEAREEWESTRPMDSYLVTWAQQAQVGPDYMPLTVEIEEMAAEWMLPMSFLDGMLEATSPLVFMEQNAKTLQASVEARWAAFQMQQDSDE